MKTFILLIVLLVFPLACFAYDATTSATPGKCPDEDVASLPLLDLQEISTDLVNRSAPDQRIIKYSKIAEEQKRAAWRIIKLLKNAIRQTKRLDAPKDYKDLKDYYVGFYQSKITALKHRIKNSFQDMNPGEEREWKNKQIYWSDLIKAEVKKIRGINRLDKEYTTGP